ncbi:DUF1254 domain-containing protein [Pseudomonas sp. PLMAX]|uniref:DUF1254 domain-containing protein n=1 Tax=Pseudomonas sp. PLMAX TaxID=2201998 RepID=UPI0038BABD10
MATTAAISCHPKVPLKNITYPLTTWKNPLEERMKASLVKAVLLVLWGLTAIAPPIAAQDLSAEQLTRRTVERRAVEAAIWGMPMVSVDVMREAFFRDAKANYNDILYWSKASDWKFQFTTPNASTHYVYFNFNLKDGPIVLDVPPTVGAGLFGSLVDAWEVPVSDVGPAGDDQGKGGKYLLLPPGYKQPVPAGYFPLQFETVNGYALLRAIPASASQADQAKAIDLVKQLRLYPLAQASNPPRQNHVDMSGKLLDGVVKFDDSFYQRLARMVNEEPVLTRDLVMMGQLRSLGIEKGKAFTPNEETRAILKDAAEEAHQGFKLAVLGGEPWWPGTQWKLPEGIGPKTGFRFQTDDALFVDERGTIFFLAFAAPKKLGAATFYVIGGHDADGQLLKGEKTYRLHVAANVPAKQYWAVTAYDLDTATLIRDMPTPGLDSYNQKMHRNTDGSVDIYFGPKAPVGHEDNWVPTKSGAAWFAMFRFYGPDKALFDKSWKLDDIEISQ